MKEILTGAVKSFTVWFGAFILAWPEISVALSDNFVSLLGTEANNVIMRVMGIVVILLRLKTNESLSDKGAKADA